MKKLIQLLLFAFIPAAGFAAAASGVAPWAYSGTPTAGQIWVFQAGGFWQNGSLSSGSWSGLTTNGLLQATSATTVASTLTPSGLTSLGVGSLTGVTSLVGAVNMTIGPSTGNSRTLALQSTTSGGVATTFLTGNADQSVFVSATGATYSDKIFKVSGGGTAHLTITGDGRSYFGPDSGDDAVLNITNPSSGAHSELLHVTNNSASGLGFKWASSSTLFQSQIIGTTGTFTFGNSGLQSNWLSLNTATGALVSASTSASNVLGAAGSVFTFNGAVASTSTSTGTVIISGSGGLGVGGAGWFGSRLVTASTLSVAKNDSAAQVADLDVGTSTSTGTYSAYFQRSAAADLDTLYAQPGKTTRHIGIRTSGDLFFLGRDGGVNDLTVSSAGLVTLLNSLTMAGTLTGAATLTGTNSITAASSTDLTLAGGSSGASLVLGQGTNGAATLTPKGSGPFNINWGSPYDAVVNITTAGAAADAYLTLNAGSRAYIKYVNGSLTTYAGYLNSTTKWSLGTSVNGSNLLAVTVATGVVEIPSTTEATTGGAGSLTTAGGIYAAKKIVAATDVMAGGTLFITSGSNAKAGTFTLSSGSATVSNTSITANSVVACTVKTSSGTLGTGTPEIVLNAGTGFTATGIATDNSTYNYVVVEVN